MNDDAIGLLTRSLKEQFSRCSEAWKEQSDSIFRFWNGGDWWASRFTVSAPVGIPVTKRRCVFTGPLEPSSLQGPKVLDFYAGFFGHRVTCLKADGKDVTDLNLILNSDSKAEDE